MSSPSDTLSVSLFSEILTVEQLARQSVAKVLPKGMELSHFMVLNHLARINGERSPAQLAELFHVTRGAMTNTLAKLDRAGQVHIRPDWDDARRKVVTISPAGRAARDAALQAVAPLIGAAVEVTGPEKLRQLLPILRALRVNLDSGA